MRKNNPNVCPHCRRSLPMTLPGYMRVQKDASGIWRPIGGICRCNDEMYKFCVLDLCEKKNSGK